MKKVSIKKKSNSFNKNYLNWKKTIMNFMRMNKWHKNNVINLPTKNLFYKYFYFYNIN